jgi:hypothetical protein
VDIAGGFLGKLMPKLTLTIPADFEGTILGLSRRD